MTADKSVKNRGFRLSFVLLLLTAFQLISFAPLAERAIAELLANESADLTLLYVFAAFIAGEWIYLCTARAINRRGRFELEAAAFFLSGIGLAICASIDDDYAVKQLIAIGLGVLTFTVLSWFIKSTDRAMALRTPVAVAALALLALNLVLAETTNGALNWITIGSFSIQPSELVKIAFIFVGASTLDKLQTTRSLTAYLVFSVTCVGALFLMQDFGTALIFFFTFILIAFMRSGDVRTIFLVCVGALLGAVLILLFKPYVAARFATYRHIWDFINDKGFQQTRVLIYSSSGGLLGLGVGQGRLRNVFAASTDLVFGMVCEEWGILLGIFVILLFAFIAFYAFRGARKASSAFYSIAAVSAAGMLLFQLSLNVFGVTDLLPLTGVTLPFISRGGTSMICSWGLFAFIKSLDFSLNNDRG